MGKCNHRSSLQLGSPGSSSNPARGPAARLRPSCPPLVSVLCIHSWLPKSEVASGGVQLPGPEVTGYR